MKRNVGFEDLRDLRVRSPRPLLQEADDCSTCTDQDFKRRRPSTDDQEAICAELEYGRPAILPQSTSFDAVWEFPLELDITDSDYAQSPTELVRRSNSNASPPSRLNTLLNMFAEWALDDPRLYSRRVVESVRTAVNEYDFFDHLEEEDLDDFDVRASQQYCNALVTPASSPDGFGCAPLKEAADFRAAPESPLWRGVGISLHL